PSSELLETVKELKDDDALGSIGTELGLNKLIRFLPINHIQLQEAKKNGQLIMRSGETSVTGGVLLALIGAIYHEKGALTAKNFIHTFILPKHRVCMELRRDK
ncbi:11052_t:CDS:2, partial [Paraglomus occultum]